MWRAIKKVEICVKSSSCVVVDAVPTNRSASRGPDIFPCNQGIFREYAEIWREGSAPRSCISLIEKHFSASEEKIP